MIDEEPEKDDNLYNYPQIMNGKQSKRKNII